MSCDESCPWGFVGERSVRGVPSAMAIFLFSPVETDVPGLHTILLIVYYD